MEIFFGILVLALLIFGLRKRKKENKEWVKEERYEESGDWLDKRAGERGTYGSLDDEMEANRRHIVRQGAAVELAEMAQVFCFTELPDFQRHDDGFIKNHYQRSKSEAMALLQWVEDLLADRHPPLAEPGEDPSEKRNILVRQVLHYLYDRYPKLLDIEISNNILLDKACQGFAERIVKEAAF